MIFVNSNIILDILKMDPVWYPWSITQLRQHSLRMINPIVYAEISVPFNNADTIDEFLNQLEFQYIPVIPKEALHLAARTHKQYRREGGQRQMILPDFLIGAHASISQASLLTRDTQRYSKYFPKLKLICP